MLTVTCLALALAWVLMHVPSLGLRGAAIALVAGDLFTAVYVLRESLRLLNDNRWATLLAACWICRAAAVVIQQSQALRNT